MYNILFIFWFSILKQSLKKQHINSWLINFVQSCLILILIKMLEDDSDGNARIARMMIVINRLFF